MGNILVPHKILKVKMRNKCRVTKTKIYKIVVLGDGGVGKTSLVNTIVEKQINVSLTPGLSVETKVLDLGEEGRAKFVFWDMGGQPQFRFFQEDFIGKAHVALLVFDVSRYSSLLKLEAEWIPMLEKQNLLGKSTLILVGNKIDLHPSFDPEETRELAQKYSMKTFFVSAVTGQNVDKLFNELKALLSKDKITEYITFEKYGDEHQ